MPWDCKACRTTVAADTVTQCPACGARKAEWSMLADRTRAFVVAGAKRVELLRGVGSRPLRPEEATAPVRTCPTEHAWVLGRAEAHDLAGAGLLPPARHVVFIRLHPKRHPDLTVRLALEHASREAEERAVPPPAGASPDDAVVDVPVVFTGGPGPPTEGLTFPGVTLVDAGEPTDLGHAPTVEVVALKRPPRRLTLSLGVVPRLVDDAGRPVALTYVYLAPPPAEGEGDGAPTLEEACFTDAEGRLGAPEGDGWQAGPPRRLVRRLPGERLRLHWSYAPVPASDLAALPAAAWSTVEVQETIVLRRSRLRGTLAARLLVAEDGVARPLAATTYRLVAADGQALEGTTDAEGRLRHPGLRPGAWRVEAAAGATTLEVGGPTDDPVDLVLGGAPRAAPPPRAFTERARDDEGAGEGEGEGAGEGEGEPAGPPADRVPFAAPGGVPWLERLADALAAARGGRP